MAQNKTRVNAEGEEDFHFNTNLTLIQLMLQSNRTIIDDILPPQFLQAKVPVQGRISIFLGLVVTDSTLEIADCEVWIFLDALFESLE